MSDQSPLWSFDLDGVLAEPPFGWNPTINRDVSLEPQPGPSPNIQNVQAVRGGARRSPVDQALDRALDWTWYRWRYILRPPRPGAIGAVWAAAARGRVIVLTGRHERGRRHTESWLDRHGFSSMIDQLVMNATGLSSARYKEAVLQDAGGARLHIDDDAATVALLARNGIPTALLSWSRNRDLPYPPHVTRCADMDAVRALIEERSKRD